METFCLHKFWDFTPSSRQMFRQHVRSSILKLGVIDMYYLELIR